MKGVDNYAPLNFMLITQSSKGILFRKTATKTVKNATIIDKISDFWLNYRHIGKV